MNGNNLILIGFMGSGKSTVGKMLSGCLEQPLKDTDQIIEAREGISINDIFAIKGEAWFRECEAKLLDELAEAAQGIILSVGGGVPVNAGNRCRLHQIGTVIYLRARPETVYERLQDNTTRPLLQTENPLEKIRTLLAQREQFYEETADIIIDVDGLPVEEVVERIVEKVAARTTRRT